MEPEISAREILKEIRLIELRTRRIVNETLAGQYHSVFKGQGMNFDEVREYQPGDEVRTIDWNVTARMNHPFVKKYVEERELTLILMVDVSGSGRFGSREQSKRMLAVRIASALAFSAIRNNDKVGVILFSDVVEKYIPPKKGRRHALRVIRDILAFKPAKTGTNLTEALRFMQRVTPHKAIVAILSDFLGAGMFGASLAQAASPALRQANRKHDVVAVEISDRHELELPAVGYLVLRDAETGELVEVNTGDERRRRAFIDRRAKAAEELKRVFNAARIDAIRVRTDEPYEGALMKFFETREKRRRHH